MVGRWYFNLSHLIVFLVEGRSAVAHNSPTIIRTKSRILASVIQPIALFLVDFSTFPQSLSCFHTVVSMTTTCYCLLTVRRPSVSRNRKRSWRKFATKSPPCAKSATSLPTTWCASWRPLPAGSCRMSSARSVRCSEATRSIT